MSTLMVPGTQATNLVDAQGRTVYNAVRVSVGLSKNDLGGRPPAEWRALLSMEHEPGQLAPKRTSLAADTVLTPGDVVRSPYDRWAGARFFPYDWRADIRWNALRLLDWLAANPVAEGWNLIGHSQGCLVIVAASKLADGDAFTRHVARVALVAGPLAGTMRATEAIMFGRADLGEEAVLPIRAASRTWPALYQMLPSWGAVLDPEGAPLADGLQLLWPEGWPGQLGGDGGIEPDMLDRGRAAAELWRDPFGRFGDVPVTAVLGQGQDTPVSVVLQDGAFREKYGAEPGDTLVPMRRTWDWGDDAYRGAAVVLGGNVRAHAWLCVDEEVVARVRSFFARPVQRRPRPEVAP